RSDRATVQVTRDGRTRRRRGGRLKVVLLLGLMFTAAPLHAQLQGHGQWVPPGHWSASAVDRLHATGVTPAGTVRGQRSRAVAEVRTTFETAAAAGSRLAAGYLARFGEEFAATSSALSLVHASVETGVGR